MGKTYLVNLTKDELEALACDYLLKNCASKFHHDDTLMARAKIIKVLRKIPTPPKQEADKKGASNDR